MPRKVKTESIDLKTMEAIVTELLKYLKSSEFSSVIKFDGITIEFTTTEFVSREKCEQLIATIYNNLNLKPMIIESRKDDSRKFIAQLPDFMPAYTEDEITKMYIANFKWLLDDATRNRPDLTKQYMADHTVGFVKQAIKTYCRSNINKYKESENDYLNNTIYRQKLNNLFLTYLDEYWEQERKA